MGEQRSDGEQQWDELLAYDHGWGLGYKQIIEHLKHLRANQLADGGVTFEWEDLSIGLKPQDHDTTYIDRVS